MEDKLVIDGREISSRLFIGTGKFSNNRLIPLVVKSSGAQVVTVALRRIDFDSEDENMLNYIPKECILMPNT